MDDETAAGVLADMAVRVVESRRRDLRETIALRLLASNGEVTAAAIADQFAAEWVEPDPSEVANIVARKAQAAVAYHQREADEAAVDAERQALKAERLAHQADHARAAAANRAGEAAPALERKADAEAILAKAVADGADPGAAPGGQDAAARAQVAEAVGAAGQTGS